jgi:predicted nucleic acid-binding protein
MYLVGTPHPNRDRAAYAIDRLKAVHEALVTDVEVYQEILHRSSSIGRHDAIGEAFTTLDDIVVQVLSYGMSELHEARDIVLAVPGISARDALHVAVMRSAGITRILSYDTGFDSVPGIERLE